MGSLKPLSLSAWLAIALLAVIAAMLVAPDIDPPDTILQGNGAPIVFHLASHHAPHGSEYSPSTARQEFGGDVDLQPGFRTGADNVAITATTRRILRC